MNYSTYLEGNCGFVFSLFSGFISFEPYYSHTDKTFFNHSLCCLLFLIEAEPRADLFLCTLLF